MNKNTSDAVMLRVPAPTLNRREWLKTAGTAVAGFTLAASLVPTRAVAQHEVDRTAKSTEPIHLNSNENPFGPSPLAMAAVMQSMDRMLRYPHAEVEKLAEGIVAKEGVAADCVVLGNGSAEVLEKLADYLGAKKGEVVCPTLTFSFFPNCMKRLGATLVEVPLDANLANDLDAMAAKITPATTCVYLCNPNNPTGTIVKAAKLKAFAIEAAKKCPVIIDEAYLDFSDDYAANTMAGLVKEGHNVIITRTFSKIYALAGERVGYGLMQPAVAKAAFAGLNLRPGFRLNMLGTVAATASLEDAAFVEETRAKRKTERDKLCAQLKGFGKKYAEAQGNFVYFLPGIPAKEFQEKMKAENIITGGSYPAMPEWCRITVGLPEEMALLSAALKKTFA